MASETEPVVELRGDFVWKTWNISQFVEFVRGDLLKTLGSAASFHGNVTRPVAGPPGTETPFETTASTSSSTVDAWAASAR